jgi:hypothetical protein
VVDYMNAPSARLAQSSIVHVLIAFLAMGSWAWFANRTHPPASALMAAVVQGCLSGSITLVLKTAIEFLVKHLSGIVALVVPPTAAFLTSTVLLSAIHVVAGTPEILATIALPLAVSTSYALAYSWSLWSLRKANE